MNQTSKLTKVTFEFPSGAKQTFETTGFVGAFIESQSDRGARLGAFATGQFTPQTITGVATAVIEAVSKEMMNQGMPPQGVIDVLNQIIPHAVESAAVREVDEHMEQLENMDNPLATAIAQLLKMAVR